MGMGTKRKTMHTSDDDEIHKRVRVEEYFPVLGTKRKTTDSDDEVRADKRVRVSEPEEDETDYIPEEEKRNLGKKRKAMDKSGKNEVSQPEEEQKDDKDAHPEKLEFPAKRNLEGLWKQLFLVGTAWEQMDVVYQYDWNFSNLEEALEEGGELHDKKVYLFGCTEPLDQSASVMVPVVVAVELPFPPSDKIGIASVQRGEEIVPMEQMKMHWLPYIPLEKRESQVERPKESQIFILSCTQKRADLGQLELDYVKAFEYCLPYFYHPFREDDFEQETEVQFIFPIDPKPVVGQFDWEIDDLEEFTNEQIEKEELPADQKQPFKDFLKETVREAKKANRQARETRQKTLAEMSETTKAAFENMKFYKFYPRTSPNTPNVSMKANIINRYYGRAHKVI